MPDPHPTPLDQDRAPAWLLPALLALVLLPRLAVFGVNENLYGDSVARMELAQRWAQDPHWISSYDDGAQQFGPLHIALLGSALWLDPDPLRAGRWVSLLFGTLSVLPLFGLTRRLFGWHAGAWAGVGLALWGLHIQCSTTAASEAVALFWMLAAFYFVQRAREPGLVLPLLWAALCMNVAAALRYDPWMLIPLLSISFLIGTEDRAAGVTRAILFGALCVPFPLLWMHGNEVAMGDPLYPLNFTNQYHHDWAVQELARMGPLSFRLRGLWFWPGAALFTLTPLLALLGGVGAVRAYRLRPATRWLGWMIGVPTGYYVLRMVGPADFVPLARFAMPQLVLLLPFLATGAGWLSTRRVPARALLATSALVAVGVAVWLSGLTWDREGKWVDSFRPVSPISRNPPSLRVVIDYLRENAGEGRVLLDADPAFWDLQLGAFLELPEDRLIRARWPDLEARLAVPPRWVVVSADGTLDRVPGLRITSEQLVLPDGGRLRRIPGLPGPLRVYGPD